MTTRIIVERRGHLLLMGLNRPEKRNAADFVMLQELAAAYGELDSDPELRAGLVYGVGDHFTAGLDLADIGPRIGAAGSGAVAGGSGAGSAGTGGATGGALDFVPEGRCRAAASRSASS